MQKLEHASNQNAEGSHDYSETKAEHAWGVSVLFYLAVIVPLWMLWEVIRFLTGW